MSNVITLKAARINAGYTQREAAEKMGVSNVTYGRWESGARAVPALQFAELCALYGYPISSAVMIPDKDEDKRIPGVRIGGRDAR